MGHDPFDRQAQDRGHAGRNLSVGIADFEFDPEGARLNVGLGGDEPNAAPDLLAGGQECRPWFADPQVADVTLVGRRDHQDRVEIDHASDGVAGLDIVAKIHHAVVQHPFERRPDFKVVDRDLRRFDGRLRGIESCTRLRQLGFGPEPAFVQLARRLELDLTLAQKGLRLAQARCPVAGAEAGDHLAGLYPFALLDQQIFDLAEGFGLDVDRAHGLGVACQAEFDQARSCSAFGHPHTGHLAQGVQVDRRFGHLRLATVFAQAARSNPGGYADGEQCGNQIRAVEAHAVCRSFVSRVAFRVGRRAFILLALEPP